MDTSTIVEKSVLNKLPCAPQSRREEFFHILNCSVLWETIALNSFFYYDMITLQWKNLWHN